MINVLLILLSLNLFPALAQQQTPATQHCIISNSELREVKSNITGENYELMIALPYSYSQDTNKHYPVVYFCDGFYDFPLLAMIYGEQIYDKTINECQLVGFSYKGDHLDYGKLRTHDYTPTKMEIFSNSGGGREFLSVIENDFIPYIQQHYRVDTNFRVLCGSSFGGLFTLYTMFTKPYLFNAYISISPAANWDNDWLFRLEDDFHTKHPKLPVSLFMTGAEKEFANYPDFLNAIKRFDEVLKKHNYENFRFQFRILDGEYHSGSKPEGYARGMMFVFEPWITH